MQACAQRRQVGISNTISVSVFTLEPELLKMAHKRHSENLTHKQMRNDFARGVSATQALKEKSSDEAQLLLCCRD